MCSASLAVFSSAILIGDASALRAEAKGIHAVSLHHKAAMWDTPKASSDHGGPNQRDGRGRPYLDSQARQWPTPRSSPNENRTTHNAPSHGVSHGKTLAGEAGTRSHQAPTPTKPGHECSPKCRLLNPRFVEWLMGFPIGHTDLNPHLPPVPRQVPIPCGRHSDMAEPAHNCRPSLRGRSPFTSSSRAGSFPSPTSTGFPRKAPYTVPSRPRLHRRLAVC